MYSLSVPIYQHISVNPPRFFLGQIEPRSRIECEFYVDVYSRNEIISEPVVNIEGTENEDVAIVLRSCPEIIGATSNTA